MTELLLLGLGGTLLATVAALGATALSRGRWGLRAIPRHAGEGAFREGPATEYRERSIPAAVWAASISSAFWGGVTFCVFAPAGALLALLMAIESARVAGILGVAGIFASFVTLGITISGFMLAPSLVGAALRIGAADEPAALHARRAARYAWLHHLVVLVAFGTIFGIGEPGHAPATFGLLLVPCSIGALVGLLLDRAAAHIERARKEAPE